MISAKLNEQHYNFRSLACLPELLLRHEADHGDTALAQAEVQVLQTLRWNVGGSTSVAFLEPLLASALPPAWGTEEPSPAPVDPPSGVGSSQLKEQLYGEALSLLVQALLDPLGMQFAGPALAAAALLSVGGPRKQPILGGEAPGLGCEG